MSASAITQIKPPNERVSVNDYHRRFSERLVIHVSFYILSQDGALEPER